MKQIIFLLLSCKLIFAGTIPSLTVDGTTYTNVELGTVSGSRVSIYYDGGGKMFAISNLPPEIQKQLHYNPQAASQQEQAAAVKKAQQQQALAESLRASEALKRDLGEPQKVHILKVISDTQLQIVGSSGLIATAYIHNLPAQVLAFVKDLNRTQVQVDASSRANENQTYTETIGRGSSARQANTYNLTDSAKAVRELRRHLSELLYQEKSGASMVMARPSKFMLGGTILQWEFSGLQATPSRTTPHNDLPFSTR